MLQEPRTRLPGVADFGSYVYVMEFNSGAVKIGRTKNPASRLKSHATSARPHGVIITAQWVSQPHRSANKTEERLLGFCNAHFSSLNEGEFFMDATVEKIVAFAETLPVSPDGEQLQLTYFTPTRGKENAKPEAGTAVPVLLPIDLLALIDDARGSASRIHLIRQAVLRHAEATQV